MVLHVKLYFIVMNYYNQFIDLRSPKVDSRSPKLDGRCPKLES